jgi:hypothetical protein
MVLAFATARFVPGVGVIFSITGSTAVVALIYVFPASFYIRLQKKCREQGLELQAQLQAGGQPGGGGTFVDPSEPDVTSAPFFRTVDSDNPGEEQDSGNRYRVIGAFVVIFLATTTGAWHMAYVVYLLASGNFLSS